MQTKLVWPLPMCTGCPAGTVPLWEVIPSKWKAAEDPFLFHLTDNSWPFVAFKSQLYDLNYVFRRGAQRGTKISPAFCSAICPWNQQGGEKWQKHAIAATALKLSEILQPIGVYICVKYFWPGSFYFVKIGQNWPIFKKTEILDFVFFFHFWPY